MQKRRSYLTLLLFVLLAVAGRAQNAYKVGYISYDNLLHSMPGYAAAQQSLAELKGKYEEEARYNEQNFRRLFAEFLQGQKDFPQTILLKRQRDLQGEMEKGLAFRHSADSLLKAAETELMAPLHKQLDAAIHAVGAERGYDYMLNTDNNACPYLNPSVAEDANAYVLRRLAQ